MTRPLHDRGARPPGRLGLVFAVLVLPLLAWVLFNHYSDRPLPSEVQALLIAQPKPLPEADNLFLALLAFPIQGREPAHERGRAALEAYDRLPEDEAPESYAEALGRNFAVFDEAPARLCSAGNQPGAYRCMHQSREDREPLQDLVLEVAPLLQRHRELQAYPAYVDPRTPTQQVPPADVTALRINLLQLSVLTWMADAGGGEGVGAELADRGIRTLAVAPSTILFDPNSTERGVHVAEVARAAGQVVGKADFDGLHDYPPGFRF